MHEFKHQQTIKPTFYGVYAVADNKVHYSRAVVPVNDKGYEFCLQQNFTQKAPILCCSFCALFYNDYLNEDGSEYITEECLLITYETPLAAMRQIYIIKNVGERKVLFLDPKLSENLKIPLEINRFNSVILYRITTNN
jgi:hypothetical protein